MSTVVANSPVAKSRRRSVSKSTKKPGEKSVKVGLYLSHSSAQRLGITATMEGRDRSAIVDELISMHLRKYVVQVRSDRAEAPSTEIEESAI